MKANNVYIVERKPKVTRCRSVEWSEKVGEVWKLKIKESAFYAKIADDCQLH